MSIRFGRRSFEKFFENTFQNVGSAFQNLRSGSINFPTSSFGRIKLLLLLWSIFLIYVFHTTFDRRRYRTSTDVDSVDDSMRDDACCDFPANRYKKRYRTSTGVDSVDVRWCMLWFSGQENTKTDIAHRLMSTRSMMTRCAMMHVVIFRPIDTKTDFAHRLMQSTESPILFRSHGHETPFSDQNGASKIGDSVL